MKTRTILSIAGTLLVIIIARNILSGRESPVVAETERVPKIVQTQIVGRGEFSEQVHVTGRIAPIKETVVSTQGTGFIGSINVDLGDRVVAGQTLARIADTYGLTGNSLEEANI
jgi:multidrug efflux pump subunit AcrA (membrane-fusion protein)